MALYITCFKWGFSTDFVDALSDPRAFLSKEEKRAKQMADMGIDENDISDVPANSGGKKAVEKKESAAANAVNSTDAEPKKGDNSITHFDCKRKEIMI